MVAVIVGLVALVSTIVFDLGNDINEPSQASMNTEIRDGSIGVSVLRSDSDSVVVERPDGIEKNIGVSSGGTATSSIDLLLEGKYSVKTVDNGNEQIVDTVTVPQEELSFLTIQTATNPDSPYFNYTVDKRVSFSKEYNIYGYYILEETSASPSDYKWNASLKQSPDNAFGTIIRYKSGSFDKFGESGKIRFSNIDANEGIDGNYDNINVSVTHDSGVPDTDVKWIRLTVEEVN